MEKYNINKLINEKEEEKIPIKSIKYKREQNKNEINNKIKYKKKNKYNIEDENSKRQSKSGMIEILDDVYRSGWVCEMTHIYFGVDTEDKTLEMALKVDARVIFDSVYNYISMPKRHLDKFKKNFMEEFYQDSCIKIY